MAAVPGITVKNGRVRDFMSRTFRHDLFGILHNRAREVTLSEIKPTS
jgi:hypothetical protein